MEEGTNLICGSYRVVRQKAELLDFILQIFPPWNRLFLQETYIYVYVQM